jgi:hypothetical protein
VQELQERSLAVSARAGTHRFVKGRRFTPYADYERHETPRRKRGVDAPPPPVPHA